ncbi:hypothetical protein QYZ87_06000 [Porphyromonadaceae bacterium W3.11]|nr:hypothetical protein [Porphyromonadaceae bacterium W3.11]
MIKHIFKIVWKERKQNAIIVIELFIIATVLWYIADMLYCRGRLYSSPKGYDITNTYNVELDELQPDHIEFIEGVTSDQRADNLLEIKKRIEEFSGVEYVSLSIAARPHSRSMMGMNIFARNFISKDFAPFKKITPDFLQVYRYEPVSDSIENLKKILENGQLIITQDYQERGIQLGDTLFQDEEFKTPDQIIQGAVKPIRQSKFQCSVPVFITNIKPLDLSINSVFAIEVGIRVKPECTPQFKERFKKEMAPKLVLNNFRFKSIEYNPDAEQVEWEQARLEAFSELFVLLFLLANILLGVAGVFWYRTVKRRSQIGLRISYGSTPSGTQRLFMLEATMMMVIGVFLAAIVMWLLFHYEIPSVELIPLDLKRYVGGLVITIFTMLGTVLLAVWLPTRKTKRIPPAEALREE